MLLHLREHKGVDWIARPVCLITNRQRSLYGFLERPEVFTNRRNNFSRRFSTPRRAFVDPRLDQHNLVGGKRVALRGHPEARIGGGHALDNGAFIAAARTVRGNAGVAALQRFFRRTKTEATFVCVAVVALHAVLVEDGENLRVEIYLRGLLCKGSE